MSQATLEAVGRTHVGRVRDHNEDTAAIAEIAQGDVTYQLWLVADGMGGGVKGEVASRAARDETIAALREAQDWADPGANLAAAAVRANGVVHDEGTAHGELSRSAMGTTLVAALVEADTGRYWIVNVGDSRAYLARGGKIQQLTRDHSLIAEQVAAGQLTEEEARTADHRNIITRAIGTDATVEPDVIGPRRLAPGERLMLCTDGLHGMVADEAIEVIVSREGLEEAADALIRAANAAGGRDNVTAVVGGWAGPAGAAGGGRRRSILPIVAGAVAAVAIAVGGALWLWPGGDDGLVQVPKGQSCEDFASQHGTTVDALRQANGLQPGDACGGRRLKVPAAASAATAPPTTDAASPSQGQAGGSIDRGPQPSATPAPAITPTPVEPGTPGERAGGTSQRPRLPGGHR